MQLAITVPFLLASNFLSVAARPADAAEIEVITTGDNGVVAQDGQLERREPVSVIILSGVVSAAAGWATTEGLDAIKKSVNKVSDNWNARREAFTKATTSKMWNSSPNPNKWKAAICYNMAYDINDRSKISSSGYDVDNGKVADVNLKSGALHTDFDCFYMASGGRFIVKGDGGYINLSMSHSPSCTYAKDNSINRWVLSCK